MNTNVEIALCWYQEDQWIALKRITPDSMDDSFEEWLESANKTILDLKLAGSVAKKVAIRVEELVAWCDERNRKPDSESRSEFAAYKLERRNR